MTPQEMANLCETKQNQLLNKYFGNLVHEVAIERPTTIDEYTKDLPLKIEAEFHSFLEELWKEHAPEEFKGTPLVLEDLKLRKLMTDDNCEIIESAYKEAAEITQGIASPNPTTKMSHSTRNFSKNTPVTYSWLCVKTSYKKSQVNILRTSV